MSSTRTTKRNAKASVMAVTPASGKEMASLREEVLKLRVHLDKRLEDIEATSVKSLKENMCAISETSDGDEKRIDLVKQGNDLMEMIKCKIVSLKTEIVEKIDLLLNRMERLENSLADIKDDIDWNSQYSRKNDIVIYGLEENAGEKAEIVVSDFLNDKLGLSVLATDIDVAHRLGFNAVNADQAARKRPMLVRFVRLRQRTQAIKNRKILKGSGIVITESLTKDRKRLYDNIRAIGLNCWTVDGKFNILRHSGELVKLDRLSAIAKFVTEESCKGDGGL